jgi:pimeloyl-ACP methyl ester carboxylesterase
MRILNIDRAHIVGLSYGGLVALQLAIDASDMVHSLSLLEPALIGYIQSGSKFGRWLETAVRFYQEGKKSEAIDSFLQYFRVVHNATIFASNYITH